MPRLVTRALLLLAGLLIVTSIGCEGQEDRRLALSDLTPAEREFVTRFVVLERARAVALADPAAGTVLLDSLAAAWGDSAQARARAVLRHDPQRAAEVYELLSRLLAAEADSLAVAPRARPIGAPLPTPAPPPPRPR